MEHEILNVASTDGLANERRSTKKGSSLKRPAAPQSLERMSMSCKAECNSIPLMLYPLPCDEYTT